MSALTERKNRSLTATALLCLPPVVFAFVHANHRLRRGGGARGRLTVGLGRLGRRCLGVPAIRSTSAR